MLSTLFSKANKPFKKCQSPQDVGHGNGWVVELDRAWSNGYYAVMARTLQTDWGMVTHVTIRNKPNTDVPWADKQIIKNKIFGYDALAIEVFPPQKDLVDEANMYHLWILHDHSLPFTL